MTTQSDSFKTNEFLHRRKLRLQQVREQSKDIAKKIRQRAKVEQLKHVVNVDSAKETAYLQRQEKLVNRLEQLYAKGLQNVGASHKNASDVNNEEISDKKDLSKLRGREAVAELRRKRQEKLDEQKKLLDRKLQAREIANELSREKSVVVANSLMKSSSSKSLGGSQNKSTDNIEVEASKSNEIGGSIHNKSSAVAKNDMGTQWEFEEIPNEWEPNIPALSLPRDDSVKNSASNNQDKADRSKRLNLFALSDEMPSSLRGQVPSVQEDTVPLKPSLTLVSEYLQNRGLRLRESDTTPFQRKSTDDLQSIKQTLLRTRASKTDGSVFSNICHVLDEQVIPVPDWKAGDKYEFCTCKLRQEQYLHHQWNPNKKNSYKKCSASYRPVLQDFSIRFQNSMPHRCQNVSYLPVSGRSNNANSNKLIDSGSTLSKKNSVTMYNHNTRDSRDLPHNIEQLVFRDQSKDEDAYSQALKEAATAESGDKEHQRAVQQETRNRIAITKQNVDKEYRDTLAFLNSLPKEKPDRSIKTAYMDGNRQQYLKEKRQQKLQQEFKKIEKECSKHHCKHAKTKSHSQRGKSKSPTTFEMDNEVNRDFQYSWMPVPERDGSLAIHTIPINSKDGKPGNTVKFSSVDTYHEYRSRHKHTPPTKDVSNDTNKRIVEAMIIQESSNDSIDSSSETDTSSVDGLQSNANDIKTNKNRQISDAERIIIYKVMESKKDKKVKAKTKSGRNKEHKRDANNGEDADNRSQNVRPNMDSNDSANLNTVSFTQLKEGVYKSVSTNGDNIASIHLSDDPQDNRCNQHHDKNLSTAMRNGDGTGVNNEHGDNSINRTSKNDPCNCKTSQENTCKSNPIKPRPSAATSTTSFQTASNDKANNAVPDGGFIKFVDEGGQEAGKFYVGASGFLKDDAYEVIIQLRKKEAEKNNQIQDKDTPNKTSVSDNIIEKNDFDSQATSDLATNQNIGKTKLVSNEFQQVTPENLANNNTPVASIPPDVRSPNVHALEQDPIIDLGDINTNHIQKTKADPPVISDKAVGTSFQDSYAIPDNVPKIDPIQRPATSTHTQTTHSSPIPRPVLMHLSSSTSTTYMSPPELVLPRFLRKGNSETCDDTYEPLSSNMNSENTRHRESKACVCGKCKRNKGVPSKRMKRPEYANAETPPNTTRSTDDMTDKIDSERHNRCYSECHNLHKKERSHTCKNRKQSKICSKHRLKRGSSGRKSRNNLTNHLKTNKTMNSLTKTSLNPVIEKYVKRLLALNKEGLKAIEVVNQECSAITTPGSSIIDLSSNINKNKTTLCNKISLEQIKNSLKEQIQKDVENRRTHSKSSLINMASQTENISIPLLKPRKRAVHKVKSLNISKHLVKTQRMNRQQSTQSTIITSPYSVDSTRVKNLQTHKNIGRANSHSISSSMPRQVRRNEQSSYNSSNSNSYTSKNYVKPLQCVDKMKVPQIDTKRKTPVSTRAQQAGIPRNSNTYSFPSHRATVTTTYSESEVSDTLLNHKNIFKPPVTASTQTIQLVDSEVEFMKLAEDKIQNMEKIADLTEKCTKRLSNLAKVLEEVRKNKSLAYSQISTSDTSDSDQRSDKNAQIHKNRPRAFNPNLNVQKLTEPLSSPPISPTEENNNVTNSSSYVPILLDLPKPESFKTISPVSTLSDNINLQTSPDKADVTSDNSNAKTRGKPPPALTRMNLKHVPDAYGIPHELSTVVEVDSPMSVKLKNHTSRLESKHDHSTPETVDELKSVNKMSEKSDEFESRKEEINPDLHKSKANISKSKLKTASTDSSDESKIKMMDLKQFNEIMLKPFISLQEYAKQCNLDEPDGGSSLNGILKDEHVNEELSSLHSEKSLPDVIAELLKRNLISEPFKFETTSNANSTTISSESTLSMLALSRVRKDKKKSSILLKNKENVAETSESLSMSSNPDLENAFQKLGMGWASSTLKKTKERLALSSSSNTSGSSMPQTKIKSFNYHDLPPLSKDSISSILNLSNRQETKKSELGSMSEISKNAVQQTSLTNSMTVKEFLTNELAKSITFTNKSNKNATDAEFVSLYETKIPEEIKHVSHNAQDNEKSLDSGPNVTNNRARTSTPVQIFKSMTYHSTSSSNTSNGLFSNADELSSVKHTSNSNKNHSTSDKDDLTIPTYSLKMRKGQSDCSKSD